MNKKKSLMLLLVLMLAVSVVLAGCGGNNEPAASNNGGGGSTPAASNNGGGNAGGDDASDLAPYKLVMTFPGGPQADEAAVEAAMNEYLTEKINATIDIMPIDWGQWNDKLNLMIASNEPIDIYFTAQWSNHAVNVAKNAFIQLEDLLQSHGQGIIETQDPAFLEGSKIDGKIWSIPTSKELAAQGGIVYRKDIADELGIDMTQVTTLQQLGDALQKVKDAKPDITPLYMREGETLTQHYFINFDYLGNTDVDGVIYKDGTETTVMSKLETDRYTEFVNITRDFYQRGLINRDAATQQTSGDDMMRAGTIFAQLHSLKPGKDAEVAAATGLEGKLSQIAFNEPTVSTGEAAGSMLAISTASKDPERAMMFINLLHTDAYLNNLLNFGIEGTHYTLNNGIMSRTDKTGDYAPGASWMFGNQFLNYLWDSEDPQKWDKFKEFNNSASLSPALGFTFDAEPIQTEAAALINVKREFEAALETGSVDPATVIPQYLEKAKAAGLDRAVAEKQKQFDAFLANK